MSIRRGGFQTRPVLFNMRIAAFARQALHSSALLLAASKQ